MAKGFRSKSPSKGISAKSGGSRRSFGGSGGSSSWSGARRASRPGGSGGGWSWFAPTPSRPDSLSDSLSDSGPLSLREPPPEPALPPLDFSDRTWRDVAGDPAPGEVGQGDVGYGVGQALGQGLVEGLGDGLAATEGSAAFWKGVAVCALVVLAVVLVLYLSR